MPRSAVTKVQVPSGKGRITYELTAAKVRALETVAQDGKLSDAVPFATARALTRQRLLEQRGADWFITPLGQLIRRRVRAKQAAEN